MDLRLRAIMDFVPIGSKVADIGTDHGYLAIELIKRKIATFVIASDKNSKPLSAAQKNIKEAGMESHISLRLGDGLQTIKAGEVDLVCIAGMGGVLMCDILDASPDVVAKIDKIILQPMNAIERVHKWAEDNNFYIEGDDLAEVDDIIYEIICLSRTSNSLRSKKKENSPLMSKYINGKIEKLQRVHDAMSKSETAKMTGKYIEIENQIIELKAKLNENTNSTNCLRCNEQNCT